MLKLKAVLILLFTAILFVGCVTKPVASPEQSARARAEILRGSYGTYHGAPRQGDHVDIARLLAELEDIHANTYHWLVRGPNGWEDLKTFLPLAREKHLRVWASLVPPSEPPPSQPFGLDFQKWGLEFAKLALMETNLLAWSIDDFPYNIKKAFTPEYVAKMVGDARAINPNLAFAPCCYFNQMKPKFVANYKNSFDGVLFPYRADSAGGNLQDATLVGPEVKKLRALWGADFPIILDIYATAHSKLGASTPDYVEQVMINGKKCCDSVLIYCHQDPVKNAEKYQVVKRQFAVLPH